LSWTVPVADAYADILVVDLLGGIGDLLMALPAIHGLARRNPGATMRVVTHEPGAELLRGDPAVTEVRTPAHHRPGAERQAVADALADRQPDLAVTTTRYDDIPALLEVSGARCVTDLWRQPPPDELVTARYMRILLREGLLSPADARRPPTVHLSRAERAEGARALAAALPAGAAAPVLLVTDAGMAVKCWPDRHWRRLVDLLNAAGHPVAGITRSGFAPALPPATLRRQAGRFAAVAARGGVVVGGDTGPLRLAAAAGARTVALFGPTLAARYGLGDPGSRELQGLPGCPHRRPTAITEQVCWWDGACPVSAAEPACMAGIPPDQVVATVLRLLASPAKRA
jgi:ADP-heptose:LPS heptosyltransferase